VAVPNQFLHEPPGAFQAAIGPFVPLALRLGIRRLGEIASGFMTIDEMADVAEEAAAECGDQGVREVIVDKAWDGVRDCEGSYWIA
jgi:hypothetical protein